ncbi:YggT family protein [candidate division KSB1 bacterium]
MGYILIKIVDVYMWIIIARAVFSWIPHNMNLFDLILYKITEPILYPLRRILPPIGGRVDLSPMLAGVVAFVVQSLI